MSDTEDFDYDDSGDDFPTLIKEMLYDIPYKKVFLLFVTMFIVLSDYFVSFLNKFSNAVSLEKPTTKGTIIQIIIILVIFIIIDRLVEKKVI